MLFQGGATFHDATLTGSASGTAGTPITYGSYGSGNANLPLGIWVKDHLRFLIFQQLTIRGSGVRHGGVGIGSRRASDITVQNDWIGNLGEGIGVVRGDRWQILHDTITGIGDSGILTQAADNGGTPGDSWVINGNTISDTGKVDLGYGEHGIYLKCRNTQVTNNTITNFTGNGVSQRYGDGTIAFNTISNGGIGIAFFPYEWQAHTSRWHDNAISNVETGMYAPATDTGSPSSGGTTRESFLIKNNVIGPLNRGSQDWINVHTTGAVSTTGNSLR